MYTVRIVLAVLLIIGLGCWAQAASTFHQSSTWDPKTTYAVVVGVLNWQDSRYHSYSTHHRKDEELYHTLLDRGVPESNVRLLLDKDATRNGIRQAIIDMSEKAPANATFIFYYAGHGYKANNSHQTFLANYDMSYDTPKTTGFEVMEIYKLLSTHFKGNQVMLLGDNCYSGALRYAAEALGKNGTKVVSLTSADEVDTSTNNWTFTQTIIDNLRGNRLAARDRDNKITLEEMASEVKDAMMYREDQKAGMYVKNWPKGMVMAEVQGGSRFTTKRGGRYKEGQYVRLRGDGEGSVVARVVGVRMGAYQLQFYNYADSSLMTAFESQCSPITYSTYPLGSLLMVDWRGGSYLAQVERVEGNFMYVTYPGWPPYTAEWVTSRRVLGEATAGQKTNAGSMLIEWQGRWYPGNIVQQKGDRYYIHYAGYDDTWNEWVVSKRIQYVQ